MSDLHLDSLEIKNFRCFEHLVVEKLGRVNLIVGKNSVGKSSLLEAISLYAHKASPHQLFLIQMARGDAFPQQPENKLLPEHFVFLFFGGRAHIGNTIEIGKVTDKGSQVSIRSILCVDDPENPLLVKEIDPSIARQLEGVQMGIKIRIGERRQRIFKLPAVILPNTQAFLTHFEADKCDTIPSDGVSPALMPIFWDRVALEARDSEVIDILNILASDIERLMMVATQGSPFGRTAYVKVKRFDKPIPLHNLGEGITRIT